MNRILLVAVLTLFFIFGKAQVQFHNDSAFKSSHFDKEVDSVFNIQKDVDFEFRFTIVPSTFIPGRQITFFILTQNHNRWKGRLFKRINSKYSETPIDSSNLKNLWTQLLNQEVLTMPNDFDLKDKQGEIARTNMKDGTTYYFSLVSKTAKRSYSYYSPKSAIEDYPEIAAFKHVSNIIDLIKKYCLL
jgi:hypothetical protein